jgi:DNA-binding CsgD family transcriptional regulator
VARSRLIPDITRSNPRPAGSPARGPAALVAELARLTIRDRRILALLAEHATFTTDQIAALAFGSLGRTRNRLATLHQRGLLDRFRHYQRPGSQSWRWTLAPLGATLLAAARGDPPPRPSAVRAATARLATSPTLNHRLAVNGFFVALAAHTRHHPDTRLTQWWNETRSRAAAGNLVRPDGHGLWHADGRAVPFWVEVDLGTEPLHRLTDKLTRGYAQLAGTRRCYPVLFWLPNPARETHLNTLLARTELPGGLVVATAAPDQGHPAGPVWHTHGQPARLALADLPMSTVDSPLWAK